jgi:SNF2 family DNA or RNA helicase
MMRVGRSLLGAQVQSGAEGVDMTRARYCVFYSLDYSLGRYDQALARVHRPGQHRPVTYVHIIAEGTVDRLVRKALTNRRNVVEDVMAEIRSQS